MLKGTRIAVLRKIQPVSIHGQISLDVFFSDADDPDGPVNVARVGGESVSRELEPGDRIELHYLMGVVTEVRKAT
jgi:hypothetical protein